MFTEKFDDYVCINDSIETEEGPFRITARVVPDHNSSPRDYDAPECCFDTSDPEHGEANQAIIDAWDDGEWCYVGIVLDVDTIDGQSWGLVGAASLWGIECNYPGEDNSYLTEVANELLQEAIDTANDSFEIMKESIL